MINRILTIAVLLIASISSGFGQGQNLAEATVAQMQAGTAGPGFYVSPRRFAGEPSAGVGSITGTVNQITASSPTGAVTLSLPSALSGISSITPASGNFTLNAGSGSYVSIPWKTWINGGSTDTVPRANGLTVGVLAGAYTPGSDPGDPNRAFNLVSTSTVSTAGTVFTLTNITNNWRWEFVNYLISGISQVALDVNTGSGGYHTGSTFRADGPFYNKGPIWAGPGAVNNLSTPYSGDNSPNNYFSVNNGTDNVIEIQNLDPAHYSAIRMMDNGGTERAATGFGNSSSAAVFANDVFLEVSQAAAYDIICNDSTGVDTRWDDSTGNMTIYASSGSINTKLGAQVFQVVRATGAVTAAGVVTTGGLTISASATSYTGTVTLTAGSGTITSAAIATTSSISLTQSSSSGTAVQPLVKNGSGSATVTGAATDNGTYVWKLIN